MFTFFTLAMFLVLHAGCNEVVKEVEGGVQLMATGKTELVMPSVVSFSMPSTCNERLTVCYTSEAKEIPAQFQTNDPNCPANSCSIEFTRNNIDTNYATVTEQDDTSRITLSRLLQASCIPKTAKGYHNFAITRLPSCNIVMNGAHLPKKQKKETEKENEKKEKTEDDVDEEPSWLATHQWVYPVGISCGMFLIVMAVFCVGVYKKCRPQKNEGNVEAAKPKKSNRAAKNIPASSPHVSPTSPMSIAVKSPNPPTTPKAAVSPVVTQKREVEKEAPKNNKKKAVDTTEITGTTEVTKSVNPSTRVPEVSPPLENIALLIDDVARSLERYGQLRFKGVQPCIVGSRLHPFLQMISVIYYTSPRRNIADYEYAFFLTFTSEAFIAAKELLKHARNELCRHGAVYSHRRWISFTKTTHRFISRHTTPGFVAWYGFAGEHGNEIHFEDDKVEDLLNKLSIPALLCVFFREELDDSIRRSALARVRRRLPQIARLFPEQQLLGMPYPLCLIPALRQRDPKRFEDAANDKTFSTPLELFHYQHRARIIDEDGTDETQVTFSDGKKRVIIGDAKIIGTPTSTTTEEKLF